MINCSQCGRENEDRHNFCLGCGANLKAQRAQRAQQGGFCPECGAPVPLSHQFCGACGARLTQETTDAELVGEAAGNGAPEDDSRKRSRAKLVLINPDGSSGEAVPLRLGENVFGRSFGPELFREDPFLSPRHAVFQLEEGRLEVRDLGSLNGVFYRIAEPTELRHDDLIRIGRQLLKFEFLDQCDSLLEPHGDGTRALGAPRAEAWGRLTRLSAPERSSEAFVLSMPEEVIGRERGTVLVRDDGFVSGRHARLTVSGGRYYIEDLRSSNGTVIRVRSRRRLENGDLLLMGQQPLRAVLN